MCRRAFVGLNRLSVPPKYRKQGRKRQNDQDFAANTIDLLPIHGVGFPFRFLVTDFANSAKILPRSPSCHALRPSPSRRFHTETPPDLASYSDAGQIQMLPELAHPFVFRRTHIVQ